jgi:hypothetical protein
MRFRLTYEGELYASGRDPEGGQRVPMAEHKQRIRKQFHGQLKQFWQNNKFLRDHQVKPIEFNLTPAQMVQFIGSLGGPHQEKVPMAEYIASKYQRNGYRFVPLVREDISILCSLDILFLRRDFPLGVISAGDLDNRVKTLIDALRIPKNANELRGNETPAEGEDPFFCLLEDDDLVTALRVETDMLLDPPKNEGTDAARSEVKLVISVELRPDNVTMFNLNFA